MVKIIKLINWFLIVICICISSLLFINKQYSLNTVKNIFDNLSSFLYLGYKDVSTSSSLDFIKIGENKYFNNSFSVYSPLKASVIKKGEDYLILKCDNGLICVFENIINIKVDVLDVINSDYSIANFIDYFIFYFVNDGVKLSYEEIMGNC